MRSTLVALVLASSGLAFSSISCSSDDGDRHVTRARTSSGDVVVRHDADRYDDRGDLARSDVSAVIPPRRRSEQRSTARLGHIPSRSQWHGICEGCRQRPAHLVRSSCSRSARTLDPVTNTMSLDGQKLMDGVMSPNHRYRIYFDDERGKEMPLAASRVGGT